MPLLLPVVAIGLFPLVMLPLLGFLGFVVLGILIGFAAVMAELESRNTPRDRHGSYPRRAAVISHGGAERSLYAVKIVAPADSARTCSKLMRSLLRA